MEISRLACGDLVSDLEWRGKRAAESYGAAWRSGPRSSINSTSASAGKRPTSKAVHILSSREFTFAALRSVSGSLCCCRVSSGPCPRAALRDRCGDCLWNRSAMASSPLVRRARTARSRRGSERLSLQSRSYQRPGLSVATTGARTQPTRDLWARSDVRRNQVPDLLVSAFIPPPAAPHPTPHDSGVRTAVLPGR